MILDIFFFLEKIEDFEINSDFEILRLNVNNKYKSLKFKRIEKNIRRKLKCNIYIKEQNRNMLISSITKTLNNIQ